jgi:aspartyl-tRNA(Asn)/glutamyl-tRNA(Gln) amidotransferase subunit A
MHTLTVTELAAGLKARQFSSLDLTLHFLGRIEQLGPELNAFVTVTADRALDDARSADARLARGDSGPLTGVPIVHKDIFCTDGILTTCSSKMLSNFVAPYDATVVRKWREAGTVLLGKTNMDEFAMGSSNETSYYGPVKNPWDASRVPGGSSGGSAAAVAACLAPAATGTPAVRSASRPRSRT